MRGQRLFVRPVEAADTPAIESFLAAEGVPGRVTACGLLGKIVGDLVAVVTCELTPDALHIATLVVAKQLRRKRIGRFMVDQTAQLARETSRKELVIDGPGDAAAYFRKLGFEGDEQRMVRRVD